MLKFFLGLAPEAIKNGIERSRPHGRTQFDGHALPADRERVACLQLHLFQRPPSRGVVGIDAYLTSLPYWPAASLWLLLF